MNILDNVMEHTRNVLKLKDDLIDYIHLEKDIEPHKEALRVTFIHGVFGVLWILLSGEFIHFITDDIAIIKKMELYKGWFYVVITVIMIYILVRKRLMLFKMAVEKIIQAHGELCVAHKALIETEEILMKSYCKIEQQKDALTISEQRYQLAVEGTKDGIWDWDIENNIVFFSGEGKPIKNNYDEESTVTFEMWKELLHPEDREKAVSNIERYLVSGNGVYKDTYRLKENDGNYLWLFSRGRAILDEIGNITRVIGTHTDITEQIKLQEVFQETKELSDNIFDNAPIIIALTDLQGKIIKCNKHTEQVTGYSYEELAGSTWIDKLILEEHRDDMEQLLKEHQNGQLVTNFEKKLLCKNGQHVNILWKNGFLYNKDGSIKAVLSMGIDVTYLKTVEKRLYYMAYYNRLTELPNRIWFEEAAKKILQDKLSLDGKMALLYLDIDNCKYINDTAGYHYGDKLLQHVSDILKHHIEQPNIVAHVAGDEFVILFEDILDIGDIVSRVENIQRLSSQSWFLEKQEIFVSMSIGVAVYPEHGTDLPTLLKNAETAMYCGKKTGKGGYSIYSEILANEALEFTWMVNELRKAVENEEFILYYQPLIDLKSGSVNGVEVLIRWNHSTRGLISPAEFIPVAEASGLILNIGKWVFENACKQKKIWNEKGYPDIKMSINLSGKELARKELLFDIKQIIEKFNLNYSSIQIEITETAAMIDLDASVNILKQLKFLGIKVALDDFGTGYSSLNYLKTLPIDVIKLDRKFIKNIHDENQEEEIIKTVIELGHILNLEVVAEGVEMKEQMAFLRRHHCNIGQGYLFSKPVPVEEIEILLSSNKQYI